ncbi:MAG: FG-GAP-like repeat-containing protein [Thermoguttaceae bacterium]|nr:FG-GAP-like repeat-containing protein [Thermoguttaceae bacterium]MDW8077427.1 FG-GAP-like repeat-containing protein [Thermoguttaceae bacterium]
MSGAVNEDSRSGGEVPDNLGPTSDFQAPDWKGSLSWGSDTQLAGGPAGSGGRPQGLRVALVTALALGSFAAVLGLLGSWVVRPAGSPDQASPEIKTPSLGKSGSLFSGTDNLSGEQRRGQAEGPFDFLRHILVPMPEVLRPDLAPWASGGGKTGQQSPSSQGADFAQSAIKPAGPWPEDPEATFSQFCARCHLLPSPDVEPRALWPAKIRQMYRYATGPRPQPPEAIPPIEAATAYWTSRAPERLLLPAEALAWPPSPLPFSPLWINIPELGIPPAIACIKWVGWESPDREALLLSDMLHGLVILWELKPTVKSPRVLATLRHPSRIEVVDLDGDRLYDLLVADLGDFWPVDTDKGRVVWLKQEKDGRFVPVEIVSGLGRVNEVKAADFDADGDLDLIVACFGNLQTGGLIYLENQTENWSEPIFEGSVLDDRPGWSDVPVLDWDGDGSVDFFALQSQEHERVLLYWNRGWGSFSEKELYRAPHPRWGSTGIVPVDLDSDGDVDLLFNHGDSFQFPPIARPFHGLTWLENPGGIPFRAHRLAFLPAAHTSVPADLDGDGDVDVISSTFMPAFNPGWPDADQMESAVWLEQVAPGSFRRWSLERGLPFHAAAEVADLDDDGDADIVLGNFLLFRFPQIPVEASLTILENCRLAPGRLAQRFRTFTVRVSAAGSVETQSEKETSAAATK